MRYFFLLSIFSVVFGYEKDITFTVQPGTTDCFYQKVTPNEVIDIEYQKLSSENTLIRESLSDVQARVTALEESASFSSEHMNELKDRVVVIEKRVPDACLVTDQVAALQNKLDMMEQQARECNIEISNVPERRNENLLSLVEQVIDASHGELDVSFQMSDPVGRIIVADYKKPENAHRHTAALEGDYRFCFDNTFSTFSTKTVFFDLLIMLESDDAHDKDYDDDKEMELGNAAESYMMRVRDISDSVTRVKDNVSAARRLQELHSAHEARDRNLAEEMCARVMTWSLWQIVLMLTVGVTQVYFVKSLFEDGGFKRLIPSFS